MCNKCEHRPVCGKYQATGGHVKSCDHFREVTKKVADKKTQEISLKKVPHKWLKLMLHLQNSAQGVFRLVFPDVKAAKDAQHRMHNMMDAHPGWFQMLITQRGCDVYVIKNQCVQKVVIRDEEKQAD